MQLIARRAIGISENRRKLYGVGFGIASFSGPYALKIEGSADVRRLRASCISVGVPANRFAIEARNPFAEDTPAIRRHAPRNVSVIVMIFLLYKLTRVPHPCYVLCDRVQILISLCASVPSLVERSCPEQKAPP
jgi:hypothetical protein